MITLTRLASVRVVATGATLWLLGCDHASTAPRLDQLRLDVVSGNGQTAVVGTQLAPLVVKVTTSGNPVVNQILNFRVLSGGGSIYGGTELTDNDGIAQELWTLGTNAAQAQAVEVRAVESSSGAEKVFGTFTATAVADKPESLFVVAGDGQTAVAGAGVATAPTVEVSDQYGNPISGVTVSFSIGSGGGSATGTSQSTSATGRASVTSWNLGTVAGPNTLLASAPSVTLHGSPVTFSANGLSGIATQLTLLSGNNQTGSQDTKLPQNPTVKVVDANGNGVPNTAVTFTVTSGGGSIDGVGAVTMLSGLGGAAAVSWTLGPTPGANTLQATAEGLSGSPIMFTATSGNFWTTQAPETMARSGSATGVVNGIVYLVGGSDVTGSVASKQGNLAYNSSTDSWATMAPDPIQNGAGSGVSYAGAGVIGGLLYVVGGCIFSDCIPGNTNAMEVYDPVANTWTAKAPMPTARNNVTTGVIGGKLYVAGGMGPCGPCIPTLALEVYDPTTDSWTSKSSQPVPAVAAAGAVVNGILYVIGGGNNTGSITTVQAYDPTTDTWTIKAPLSVPRSDARAGVVNGIIYVTGGSNGTSVLNSVEAYDPTSNTWTSRAAMPTARAGLSVGVVNGVVYATGGAGSVSGQIYATNEAYHP